MSRPRQKRGQFQRIAPGCREVTLLITQVRLGGEAAIDQRPAGIDIFLQQLDFRIMQLDAFLQCADFVAIACDLRFQCLPFGFHIVAAHIEQRALALQHVLNKHLIVFRHVGLLRRRIVELAPLQFRSEPRPANCLRGYLQLQIGIFLLRGDQLHACGHGRRFALACPAAERHQFQRDHAWPVLIFAGRFNIAHDEDGRILIDGRRHRQAGNMLRQGCSDPRADFSRRQTAHGDVADDRVTDIAVDIDRIKPCQGRLAINRDLQHVIGADAVNLPLGQCQTARAEEQRRGKHRCLQMPRNATPICGLCHRSPSYACRWVGSGADRPRLKSAESSARPVASVLVNRPA